MAAEKRARRAENPRGSKWTRTLDSCVCVVCVFMLVCTAGFPYLHTSCSAARECTGREMSLTHTLYSSVFRILSYSDSLSCCSRLFDTLGPATRPSSFALCQLLQAPVNHVPNFGAKYSTCQKPFLLLPLIFHTSQHKLGPLLGCYVIIHTRPNSKLTT